MDFPFKLIILDGKKLKKHPHLTNCKFFNEMNISYPKIQPGNVAKEQNEKRQLRWKRKT